MSGTRAITALAPKLLLLAAVLLGMGVTYATAHLCTSSPSLAVCVHSGTSGDSAVIGSPGAVTPAVNHEAARHSGIAGHHFHGRAEAVGRGERQPAAHDTSSGTGPSVLCMSLIAAILLPVAAVLARAVLRLLLTGLVPIGGITGRLRTPRLPAVRGSPLLSALSLRRAVVLRV
jgi:hypothetical protein